MSSSYSTEFRQKAAKSAVESDESVAKTARDLGVNPNTLYTWIKKYQQPDSPATNKGVGDKHPYEELKRLRRENALLKEERDIFKKGGGVLCKKQSVKYAWMQQQTEFGIRAMCRVLQVSRSGYYESLRRPPSAHSIEDDKLRPQIKAAFKKGRKNYGTRRIKDALKNKRPVSAAAALAG